jgi:hypothetical protein
MPYSVTLQPNFGPGGRDKRLVSGPDIPITTQNLQHLPSSVDPSGLVAEVRKIDSCPASGPGYLIWMTGAERSGFLARSAYAIPLSFEGGVASVAFAQTGITETVPSVFAAVISATDEPFNGKKSVSGGIVLIGDHPTLGYGDTQLWRPDDLVSALKGKVEGK